MLPNQRPRSGSYGGESPIQRRLSYGGENSPRHSAGRPRSSGSYGGESPIQRRGSSGRPRSGSYGGENSPRHSAGRPRSRGHSGGRHSSLARRSGGKSGERSSGGYSGNAPAPPFVARRSDSSAGSDQHPRERRVSIEWAHLQGALDKLEQLAIRRLEGGEAIGADIGLGLSDMSSGASSAGATSGEDSEQEPVFERRRSSVTGGSRRGSGLNLSALAGLFGRRLSGATAAPDAGASATENQAERAHKRQSEAARRASALWAKSGEVTATMDFTPPVAASPPCDARRAERSSAPAPPQADASPTRMKAAFQDAFTQPQLRAATTEGFGDGGVSPPKPKAPRRSPPTATRAPLAPRLSSVTLVTLPRTDVQLKHTDGGSANSLPGIEFASMRINERRSMSCPGSMSDGHSARGTPLMGHRAPVSTPRRTETTPRGRMNFMPAFHDPDECTPDDMHSPSGVHSSAGAPEDKHPPSSEDVADLQNSRPTAEKQKRVSSPPVGEPPAAVAGAL